MESEFDAARRPVATRLTAGGGTRPLTQTSYDIVGRTDCVAVRMKPATFDAAKGSGRWKLTNQIRKKFFMGLAM